MQATAFPVTPHRGSFLFVVRSIRSSKRITERGFLGNVLGGEAEATWEDSTVARDGTCPDKVAWFKNQEEVFFCSERYHVSATGLVIFVWCCRRLAGYHVAATALVMSVWCCRGLPARFWNDLLSTKNRFYVHASDLIRCVSSWNPGPLLRRGQQPHGVQAGNDKCVQFSFDRASLIISEKCISFSCPKSRVRAEFGSSSRDGLSHTVDLSFQTTYLLRLARRLPWRIGTDAGSGACRR